MSFPFFRQYDTMDCGPTCLRMIAKYYGKDINMLKIRELSNISREGVSLLGISEAAEKIGFKSLGAKLSFEQLDRDAKLPCILHWGQNHFVVLPPQNFKNKKNEKILIADPGIGLIKIDKELFLRKWLSKNNSINNNGDQVDLGIVLLLEPTNEFEAEKEGKFDNRISWYSLFYYLKQHKKLFFQVVLSLSLGSLLQLIFPFLTQSIVDIGINTKNLQFIYIVLIAQFILFFARTINDFIRSRLLLFISSRISISLLTGFWYKLMKLPISFFDTKLTGDIQQRLQDQQKIESFLTGSSLSILFSVVNLIIYSVIVFNYNFLIFSIIAISGLIYLFWIKIFLKKRRDLNYMRFEIAAENNSTTLQLIQGMQEIKLNNSEKFFRWNWEGIQVKLFNLSFKSLSLNQLQQSGAFFINEGKNILITFFVAKLVYDGHLTLGAMIAIQYMIGQLNSPIEQLIGFSQTYQDAKIALERLNEIYQMSDEEPVESEFDNNLPLNRSLHFSNVSFTYNGAGNINVLKNINLTIPERRITAIVGMSGSGKTTLLKLLLKFYDNYNGVINIGIEKDLKNISPSYWRDQCGSVMQDGYIFNDTIARNIAVGEESSDKNKLLYACNVANIMPFIEALPLGFNTKIGLEGNGISQGQKQRILIARAVYKNPEYIFFDEATNALDANNEKIIMENLNTFFKGKTVLIVAHRLSTVKNADKIIVLHQGEIVEDGTHDELVKSKSYYYELVKNQLELGN